MNKTIGLLTLSLTLHAQSVTPTFVGHMISCGDGYTTFRTLGGELVRTSDSIGCREYTRYREWRVYTEPGGAHPDRVMAIEPSPTEWEYRIPVVVSEPRKWKWFKWLRK